MGRVEGKDLKKSKILQAVHQVSKKSGAEVYLVGGAVRDLFLGRLEGKDLDFVTAEDAKALSQELAQVTGGHSFSLNDSFGTWRVVLKQGKKKVDVDFSPMQGKDILADLEQRDFTINSMAFSVQEVFQKEIPALLDPLDGLSALRQRILRANSETSLRQDPLRMLRAFRLRATLGLQVEEETLRIIQRNKSLIRHSAWERIRDEFFGVLQEFSAGRFLRELHRLGLLEEIFPEINGWNTLDQGAENAFSLLEHVFRTVEGGELLFAHFREVGPAFGSFLEQHFAQKVEEGISRKALFKFVAFFHDSGKPQTKNIQGTVAPFPDHDQQGQKINIMIARRLKLSRRSVRIVGELTRQHMRLRSLSKVKELTSRAKYRFFYDLREGAIETIILALADGFASKKVNLEWPLPPSLPSDLQGIKETALELLRYYYEEYSVRPQKSLFDGKEIMKALGLPEGERVGYFLARLQEAETAGTVRTKAEALKYLKNIDRSRALG